MINLWAGLIVLLFSLAAHAQDTPTVFTSDVQMCSGRPWIDVTCNGADPTGATDSTTAINTTFATAITNGWPVMFPSGTFRVTSKITVDYAKQANNGLEIISRGATLDGRSFGSGNVLQIDCSGGTMPAPIICDHLRITGELTVSGSTSAYVVVIGKTDLSDRHNAARIEHLVATNAGTGGGIQANYMTDGELWFSGSTQGGSSSVGGVALEQVQTSQVGGYGSALGTSAPALLIENGASVGDVFTGFAYDPNTDTCVSITAAGAARSSWIAPHFPCTTAINAPTSANQNIFLGPTFAGTNAGPNSTGATIVGRGSLNRYSSPAVSSRTLVGTDDGTIFSSANATGPSTQFTAASLPVTLPTPSQVGVGWTVGLVSDSNKAVVASAPGGVSILGRNRALSQLIVGSAGTNGSNYEVAVLQSDGANYRVLDISDRAAQMNGLRIGLPWNWYFPDGPGYQATIGDNGGVISSGQTSAGLQVTLPSTTAIVPGWTVSFSQDGGKPLSVQTNGANGGQIYRAFGAAVTSFVTKYDHQIVTIQFDGSNFRDLASDQQIGVDVRQFGARCDWQLNNTDDTAAFQAAINAVTTGTNTKGAVIEVPATGYGCRLVHGLTVPAGVTIQGVGMPYWQGPLGNTPSQWVAAGSWVECEDTVNPCINLTAPGDVVRNLSMWFTQPTPATLPATTPAWTPTQYGWAIAITGSAQFTGLENLHILGATKCVDWEGPNSGVAGIFSYMRNILFDGCFDIGTRFHRIDNTLTMDNLRYDVYWNVGSLPMLDYMESHKIDWDIRYLANPEATNIEFFESWHAIQLTNDTVVSGFGDITSALSAGQFTNISFNEVCQAVAPSDSSARGDATMSNVIIARDTTSPTHCANGTDVMFDLTSNYAYWQIQNVRCGDVQTIASLGQTGTLKVNHASCPAYSFFSIGAPAFKVSANAELMLDGVSRRDILPAPGGGPVVACGADTTCGWSEPVIFGLPGEGGVMVRGSGDTTNAGDIEFYAPDGVTRRGYIGRGNANGEINIVTDLAGAGINLGPGDGAQGTLQVTNANGNLAIILSNPPTSCTGQATGTLWNNSGNLSICP